MNNNYELVICSYGSKAKVYSNIDLFPMLFKIKDNVDMPDWTIQKSCDTKVDVIVDYKDSDDCYLDYQENAIQLAYPFSSLDGGRELLYIVNSAFELVRQQKNQVSFHGACIAYEETAKLILGKAGAGKTSIVLEASRKYGAKLIANDITIIDYKMLNSVIAVGGTKYITLRRESIRRNLPELENLYFNERALDLWLEKKRFNCAELGITQSEDNIPINKVFFVHVDEQMKELVTKKGNTIENRLYLYENFSRGIRNTQTALFIDGRLDGFIPSFDSKKLSIERNKLINSLVENSEYVSGNIQNVTEYIIGGKK